MKGLRLRGITILGGSRRIPLIPRTSGQLAWLSRVLVVPAPFLPIQISPYKFLIQICSPPALSLSPIHSAYHVYSEIYRIPQYCKSLTLSNSFTFLSTLELYFPPHQAFSRPFPVRLTWGSLSLVMLVVSSMSGQPCLRQPHPNPLTLNSHLTTACHFIFVASFVCIAPDAIPPPTPSFDAPLQSRNWQHHHDCYCSRLS